jgi:hypothetical protein
VQQALLAAQHAGGGGAHARQQLHDERKGVPAEQFLERGGGPALGGASPAPGGVGSAV